MTPRLRVNCRWLLSKKEVNNVNRTKIIFFCLTFKQKRSLSYNLTLAFYIYCAVIGLFLMKNCYRSGKIIPIKIIFIVDLDN